MQGYGETRAKAQEVDTPDPDERIRQLCEENRRLRKQIRQLKAAAAAKKKSGVFKARFSGREYRHHSDHRLFLPHDLAHHGHLGAGLPDTGRVR